MIVVDASVVVALIDDAEDGDRARLRLRDDQLLAPELIDLEVLSAARGLVLAGRLSPRRAELALADLAELPLDRVPHLGLLERVWDLRANITAYEAAYVAAAEALGLLLLTADARLARAPGLRCAVELLA